MKPFISVIVPTYNEERYVEETMKSIRNQEFENYELVVSDCYSEDNTVEITGRYADRVVLNGNRSTGSARNNGAENSEGKYLIFVDADTTLSEDYLKKAYEIFKERRHVAFSGAFKFSNDSVKYKTIEKIVNSYFMIKSCLNQAILPGFNFCIPRNIFEKVGGFDDIFIEDAHLATKLNRMSKTRYFTHFYAITSPRRVDELGVFGSLDYYLDLRRRGDPDRFSDRYINVR